MQAGHTNPPRRFQMLTDSTFLRYLDRGIAIGAIDTDQAADIIEDADTLAEGFELLADYTCNGPELTGPQRALVNEIHALI